MPPSFSGSTGHDSNFICLLSMGHAKHLILGKYLSILHLYCMVRCLAEAWTALAALLDDLVQQLKADLARDLSCVRQALNNNDQFPLYVCS